MHYSKDKNEYEKMEAQISFLDESEFQIVEELMRENKIYRDKKVWNVNRILIAFFEFYSQSYQSDSNFVNVSAE